MKIPLKFSEQLISIIMLFSEKESYFSFFYL